MAPKAATAAPSATTGPMQKKNKLRTGTFKSRDYMQNGQLSRLQEKGMAGCSEANVLANKIKNLARSIEQEKTLAIPSGILVEQVEEDRNVVAQTLGAVVRALQLRDSNLEHLKKLRDDVLIPFFKMAQNPGNFEKTALGVATVKQTREAAWRFLCGTKSWQDVGEQAMARQYQIEIVQTTPQTIEVQQDEIDPYKNILQDTLSAGDVFDVENLWRAVKNAFKEFSTSVENSKTKLAKSEEKAENLEKQNKQLKKDLESAKALAESANTVVEVDLGKETLIAELQNDVQQLESRIVTLEDEKDKLDEKLTNQLSRLDSKNETIKTLRKNIKTLEGAPQSDVDITDHPLYKKAQDDIELYLWGSRKVGEEATQFRDQAIEARKKSRELVKKVSKLEKERDGLANSYQGCKEQHTFIQKNLDDAEDHNEHLQSQVEHLIKTEKRQLRQIGTLETSLEKALRDHGAVQNQLSTLETTYQQAVGQTNALIEEHSKLQVEHERVLEAQTCMQILARALPPQASSSSATQPGQSAESATAQSEQAAPDSSSLSNTGEPDETPPETGPSSLFDNKATVQRLLEIVADSKNLTLDKSISDLMGTVQNQIQTAGQQTTQLTSALETEGQTSQTRHESLLDLLKKENEATLNKIRSTDSSVQASKDEAQKKFETITDLLQTETDAAKKRADEVIKALNSQNEATKKRLEDQTEKLASLTVDIQTTQANQQQHANDIKEIQTARDEAIRSKDAAEKELNDLKLEKQGLENALDNERVRTERLNNDVTEAKSKHGGLEQQLEQLNKDLNEQQRRHEEDTANLRADSANLEDLRQTHQTTTTRLTKVQEDLLELEDKFVGAQSLERVALQKLEEQNKRVAELTQESTGVEAARQYYEGLSKNVADTQKTLDEAQTQLNEERIKYETLHGKLAQEKDDLAEDKQATATTKGALEERVAALEIEKATFKTDKENFDKERSTLNARIPSLQEQITALEEQITRADKTENDLRSNIEAKNTEILNQKIQIIRLNHNIEKADREKINHDVALEHAKIDRRSAMERHFKLESKVTNLNSELAAEKATRKAYEATIDRLTRESNEHRLSSTQITSGLERMRSDLQTSGELNQQIGRLNGDIAGLKAQLERSKESQEETAEQLNQAREAKLESSNELAEAKRTHSEQVNQYTSEIDQHKQKQAELLRERDEAIKEREAAKEKAEQHQTAIDSINKDKTKLEKAVHNWKRITDNLTNQLQLLLFGEPVPLNDFQKLIAMISKISRPQLTVAYEYPLEEALGLDSVAQNSIDWVLSLRTSMQTAPYLALTVDQLMMHLFSTVCVRPEAFAIYSMLEALSVKAKTSQIVFEKAFRLDNFLDHLFAMPATDHLLLVGAMVMEVIITSVTKAGHRWRRLAEVFGTWDTQVGSLGPTRVPIIEGYTQWFRSLIADEQAATLPDLLCSLTPIEQQVTETATGRVMLGSVMGPGIHLVVDLTAQQIALFGAAEEGIDYTLPSRFLKLPERRLRNNDFGVAAAFKIPVANRRFITDYAMNILELAFKDPNFNL